MMKQGLKVALVSDAGTPLISDPGLYLISKAIDEGIGIDCLPGPTAAVNALCLSGFQSQKFSFEGYL